MLEIWQIDVGDTVFCVWPSCKWVTGKGWVEAKEGYQIVTAVEGNIIQTDVSKGWVSVEAFIKILKIEKKPVTNNDLLWEKSYYLKDTHVNTYMDIPVFIKNRQPSKYHKEIYGVGGN